MTTLEKNIVFEFPDETTEIVDVVYDILKSNGRFLSINPTEWPEETEQTHFLTVLYAAIDMFENKNPEEEISTSLQKHLKVSPEVAKKIIYDIKQKLVPYMKVVSPEEAESEKARSLNASAQEFILEKIKQNAPKKAPLNPSGEQVKKVEITSVEENAKINEETKKYTPEIKEILQNKDTVAPRVARPVEEMPQNKEIQQITTPKGMPEELKPNELIKRRKIEPDQKPLEQKEKSDDTYREPIE